MQQEYLTFWTVFCVCHCPISDDLVWLKKYEKVKGFSTVAGGITESSRLPVGEEGVGGEGSSQSDGI